MSLRFDGVGFAYGDGALILDELSLEVAAGAVVGILGPSGCGKTTLLQLAAGLLKPRRGAVISDFVRRAIVFQEPRLLPWRSALDNLAFGLKAMGMGRAERRAKARALLTRLGMSAEDARKYPRALSGGMRQRLGVGRALAIQPDLLLLDEPFSAADVGLRRELQDWLRNRIEESGVAALFVTHDVAEAVRLADHLVVLSERPARIVYRQSVPRPFAQRDEAFVLEEAAAFLRQPAVAAAFRVPAAVS